MNNITQKTIFDYEEIEILGDLERLVLFLDNIEDNELCETLQKARANGRDDYPIRTMLNLIYAMKIFGHRSVESFRRELSRNSGLRKICGLKEEDYLYLGKRNHLVPPARVFTNFFKLLIKHQEQLDKKFESSVDWMYENLPDFGKDSAIDGKIIPSYANDKSKAKVGDNRGEHDAEFTAKTYHFADGTKKTKWQFGFNTHILCCAKYGLPIHKEVLPANISEQKVLDGMLNYLEINNEKVLDNMENLLADAGYDNGKRNQLLKEKYNINPIIDIRKMWSKREPLREVDNKPLAYNEDGEVFYITDIITGEYEKLIYLGYDNERKCLRYGHESKPGVYRIPLKTDYRVFTPVARDSQKFQKKYKMRTEVERLNGRLDRDYMFNDHFLRGRKKVDSMVTLSFIIMLTMAKGHIKNNKSNIRSLVN
ncbi:MAG: transposase [Bacilli bacterium]